MNEADTIAVAFAETLREYQIHLSVEDAADVCCVRARWQQCMTWISTVEQYLSFGQVFRQPPECLSRILNDAQKRGEREAFLPPKKNAPLPAQKTLWSE